MTFLSGGAEDGENGGAGEDQNKTVVRTYDSALKKWTLLEPLVDKKTSAVPDERFGASSTFISDQKVVHFGGVKKRVTPSKNKNKKTASAMEKQNAPTRSKTFISSLAASFASPLCPPHE